MPIKAQSLAERATETARIDYGDLGDLNVKFYPGKFTVGFLGRLSGAETDDQLNAALEEFCTIVTEWDLLGPDDKPLPVSRDTAVDQGLDVLRDIVQGIGKQLRPSQPAS